MKMWKTTNPSSWWLAGMVWFINNISDTVCLPGGVCSCTAHTHTTLQHCRHREQNSCLSDSVPLNYLQRVWFISGRYTRHPSWTAETQLFVNLYSYLSSVVTRSRFIRRTPKIYKSVQSTGGRWWRQWDLKIVYRIKKEKINRIYVNYLGLGRKSFLL